MRNRIDRARLAALLLLLPAAVGHAEHHVRLNSGAELGVGYDDNVGNAAEDGDARDSAVLNAGTHIDYTRALSLRTALLVRGTVQGEAFEAESGLSHLRVGGMARLSHRPGSAFHTPTLAAWLSAGALEFDSAMRDGFELRAGLHAIEALTTALALRATAGLAERRADNAVFDASTWSVGLNVDWSIASRVTLYGGYQFQDGDIASTGSVPPKSTHDVSGCGTASACDADDAIEGLFAYRIEGDTQVATLGANVALSPQVALDAQLRHADASAGENGYERLQAALSVLKRF